MKKKYLLILLILSFHIYNSQNISTNNNFALPKITPPSQETFANSRINFEQSSSGDFNYQFPIYNGIRAPISLSYTSGVKVDDIGSSIGMSWKVSAGGVISRVVKDETDENRENWKPDTVNETADIQKIKNAAKPGNPIDTEYDWFNFSISNGLSGSFYIDKDLNVFIESKDKVKIEISVRTSSLSVYGKLLEFKLTDKLGNEYYFGGSEINVEKTTYENSGPNLNAVTGWYLFKMITPEKKETIFNYTTENLNYYISLDASFNVQHNCSRSYASPYIYSDIIKSKSTIRSLKPKLQSIMEDDKHVNFIYSKERKDLLNNNSGNNLLTSIEIKSNNRVIGTYSFEYFDVQSLIAATYYSLPYDETSTRNRYFLKLVKNVNKNIRTEFEYYDLASLPSRFSLGSDYYGYANGVSNSSPFPAIASDNNFGIFKGFSNIMPLSMFSADKKVRPLLASIGNLKKITHPTKGISEIFYEPNSSMEQVTEQRKVKGSLIANYNRCNMANYKPKDFFTFVSNGSPIEYYGTAFFDDTYPCGEPDGLHDIHSLTITNLTTGNNIVFSKSNQVSEPFRAEIGTNFHPIYTVDGQTYKVEYSVSSRIGVVSGSIFLEYNEGTIIKNELKYFGGSRVASIKESTIEGGNYVRKFYYNKLSEIASQKTSIRNYNAIHIMAQKQETSKSCLSVTIPYVEIRDVYSAYQNSLLPYFNHRNNKIFYTDITEIVENKSAVERKFSYRSNLDPYIGRAPEIYNLPKTNYGDLMSNLLLEENNYKFENGAYNQIMNKTYKYDYAQVKSLKSYVFRENFMYNPDPVEDQLLNISYGFYENFYGFYNPTQIVSSEYLPNNATLITTITNSYINPNHYQLTSSKIKFPDQSVSEATYQYAHEKNNQKLINANIIGIPLETSVVQKQNDFDTGKTISRSETKYDDPANLFPTSVISYDLLNNTPSTEITYDKYDAKGNIQQYTTKDGIPTTIIWGYNQTQPIAKVEGAKLSNISQSLLNSIVNASKDDAADPSKEGVLITALDTFRKNSGLSAYQIFTYTYDPLIGVTSITPPSGIREVYIYDTANRLKEIRENSKTGKLVKEFKYNYKN